jgi:hypothetical protein
MSSTLTVQHLNSFRRGGRGQFSDAQIAIGTWLTSHLRFDPGWDKTGPPEQVVLLLRQEDRWLKDKNRACRVGDAVTVLLARVDAVETGSSCMSTVRNPKLTRCHPNLWCPVSYMESVDGNS